MKKVKVTTKFIMSCIIVCLFCMFSFEMAYNHLMYKDYAELYDEYVKLENRVDHAIKSTIQVQKFVLQEHGYTTNIEN